MTASLAIQKKSTFSDRLYRRNYLVIFIAVFSITTLNLFESSYFPTNPFAAHPSRYLDEGDILPEFNDEFLATLEPGRMRIYSYRIVQSEEQGRLLFVYVYDMKKQERYTIMTNMTTGIKTIVPVDRLMPQRSQKTFI